MQPTALRQGLSWYLRRLSVMGPREILHRIGERFTLSRLHLAHRLHHSPAAPPPAPGVVAFCNTPHPCLPPVGMAPEPTARLLAGHWPALGFDWQWSDDPEIWRLAPDTGRAWPKGFFASIAYRADNPYGDVRVAWEPARLQQLVALAVFANQASDADARRAVTLLEDQFLSWVNGNPPLDGIHYISAMECGLRIIAVCHALDQVRDRLTRPDKVWRALLGMVANHAVVIERRVSLHSSAGNHTVAECAGLIYAAVLFPELPGSDSRLTRALRLMASEVDRQILADGGSLEQAIWYLLFITDLAGLVLALLAKYDRPPPALMQPAFERGRKFLRALSNASGDLPPIGDRDDGFALVPGLRLAMESDGLQPTAGRKVQTFRDAGFTLMRNDVKNRLEVLMDHGPLGMAPSFGHGHADALALVVCVGDTDLLVDPGTYTYTGDLAKRRYYRSTAAHNTIVINGADQAFQETPFMWSEPYAAELVSADTQGEVSRLLARHDGYMRRFGVMHWRGVALGPWGLWVWDYLEGTGRHTAELRWHCGVSVEAGGGTVVLDADHQLEITGADTVSCEFGAAATPAASQSRRYGQEQDIWTVTGRWTGDLPHNIVTALTAVGDSLPPEVGRVCREQFKTWLDRSQSG